MQTTTAQDTLRDTTAVVTENEPSIWIWIVLAIIVIGLIGWAISLYRRSKRDETPPRRGGGGYSVGGGVSKDDTTRRHPDAEM